MMILYRYIELLDSRPTLHGIIQFIILLNWKKDLTVGIISLGYVGLPTAIGFHDAGFTVWGVDV